MAEYLSNLDCITLLDRILARVRCPAKECGSKEKPKHSKARAYPNGFGPPCGISADVKKYGQPRAREDRHHEQGIENRAYGLTKGCCCQKIHVTGLVLPGCLPKITELTHSGKTLAGTGSAWDGDGCHPWPGLARLLGRVGPVSAGLLGRGGKRALAGRFERVEKTWGYQGR